jgi:hypothetical protein
MTTGQTTQANDILDQVRRILTQTPSQSTPEASSPCCSSEKQEVCCEPSEKSTCCGAEATAGGGCGCQ